MSFTPTSAGPLGAPGPSARRWPRWLREPLLHFALIGAALFAVDHVLVGRADDPRSIVIDASVDAEALKVFRDARGRDPNAEELYALRRVWLDNEVLYREGLALQMDKGDKAIRDRVIFKTLSMINADLKLPPVDDTVLRDWFERHRARYDEPPRYDFQEAVMPEPVAEVAARALAQQLNGGAGGELAAGLRVFKGRPHDNIVQSYGADFARALEAAPVGEWVALPQPDTWRVMRLDAVAAAKGAQFEALRGVVLQDWTDSTLAAQRSAAVQALARKYTVRVEAAAP